MRQAVLSKEVLENCPTQVKDRNGQDYTHWCVHLHPLLSPGQYSPASFHSNHTYALTKFATILYHTVHLPLNAKLIAGPEAA